MQIRDANGRFMAGAGYLDRIGVRLSRAEGEELRQRAAAEERSISDLVRWALEAALVLGAPVEHRREAQKWS